MKGHAGNHVVEVRETRHSKPISSTKLGMAQKATGTAPFLPACLPVSLWSVERKGERGHDAATDLGQSDSDREGSSSLRLFVSY